MLTMTARRRERRAEETAKKSDEARQGCARGRIAPSIFTEPTSCPADAIVRARPACEEEAIPPLVSLPWEETEEEEEDLYHRTNGTRARFLSSFFSPSFFPGRRKSGIRASAGCVTERESVTERNATLR